MWEWYCYHVWEKSYLGVSKNVTERNRRVNLTSPLPQYLVYLYIHTVLYRYLKLLNLVYAILITYKKYLWHMVIRQLLVFARNWTDQGWDGTVAWFFVPVPLAPRDKHVEIIPRNFIPVPKTWKHSAAISASRNSLKLKNMMARNLRMHLIQSKYKIWLEIIKGQKR